MRPRTEHRGGRPAWASIAAPVVALMVFAPVSPAVAQDCAATDLTCALSTVDDPVPTVEGSVTDLTDSAQQDVSQAVEDVKGTLDGLTGSGEDPPDGGGGSGGGGGGGGGAGSGDHSAGSSPGDARAPSLLGGPNVATREGGTFTLLGAATDPSAVAAVTSATTAGAARRIREATTGITLSLLMVLAALLLFTALQDRLDRREPRLALAPVTGDFVTFE
ncbi:MAG: hypothetical protein ABI635_11360 [Actinomycetota bacterium]